MMMQWEVKEKCLRKVLKWDLNRNKTSNLEYFFYLQERLNRFT